MADLVRLHQRQIEQRRRSVYSRQFAAASEPSGSGSFTWKVLLHYPYHPSFSQDSLCVGLEHCISSGDVANRIPSRDTLISASKADADLVSHRFGVKAVVPVTVEHKLASIAMESYLKPGRNTPEEFMVHIVHENAMNYIEHRMKDMSSDIKILSRIPRRRRFLIACPFQEVSFILPKVAAESTVTWIEPKVMMKPLNYHAAMSMQSVSQKEHILWDKGLTGKSQVVAHGDSGVDHRTSFFHDPNHAVVINKVNMDHRKVILYRDIWESSSKGTNFHGTHTAATVAGKALCPLDAGSEKKLHTFDGMAKDAKIAIYDLGRDGSVELGDDVYSSYFALQYNDTPARISSNSWGTSASRYDYPSYDSDAFMWDHPDFLIVYAAGNSGDLPGLQITTPGQSKNALTVGASTNTNSSFIDNGRTSGLQLLGNSSILQQIIHVAPLKEYAPFSSISLKNASIQVFSCAEDSRGSIDAPIVLVMDCFNNIRVRNLDLALNNSNASVVLLNREEARFFIHLRGKYMICTLKASLYDFLAKTLKTTSLNANFPVSTVSQEYYDHVVPTFSSKGPTVDGRIKPDIIAPGEFITSAVSSRSGDENQCNAYDSLETKKGTSMASAVVAGHAVLVRQYFMEGWYPSGIPIEGDAFTPSGALLKAVFINSGLAVTLSGDPETSLTIPSFQQGFGQSILERTLFFNDSSTSLYVQDTHVISMHEHSSFCFQVSPSRPFKVTLVWTDPPADVASDVMLMNNLDLSVISGKNGSLFVGNRDILGNDDNWDELNNVEQVIIAKPEGVYTVDVFGTDVIISPQPFALVVSGNFSLLPSGSCHLPTHCPNACNNRGKCIDKVCVCEEDFSGSDCSSFVKQLIPPVSIEAIQTEPGLWTYFRIDLGQYRRSSMEQLKFTIDVLVILKKSVHFQVFVRDDAPPTMSHHVKLDKSSQIRASTFQRIVISPKERSSSLYVGIYQFCCEPVNMKVSVAVDAEKHENTSQLELFLWIACAVSILLSIGIYYSLRLKSDFQRISGESDPDEDDLVELSVVSSRYPHNFESEFVLQ